MIIYLLVACVVILVLAWLALARNVNRLDSKREVVQLYENVEWNTEAAGFVRRELARLKWSIIAWVCGLLLMQTVVIFLAIIYVLETSGPAR